MSIPTQLTAAWFQPVFTCSTAAAAAALLLHRRSAAICRAQTDTSWASIKHQLSSPAVLGCQRETESVSPEQPPSPSEHFHYVSLDKLLPPPPPHVLPPPLSCSQSCFLALRHHTYSLALRDSPFIHSVSLESQPAGESAGDWVSAVQLYVTRSHKNKQSYCKISRLCQWREAASVHTQLWRQITNISITDSSVGRTVTI